MADSVEFSDTFTEASDTALTSHTMDTPASQGWTSEETTVGTANVVAADDEAFITHTANAWFLFRASTTNLSSTRQYVEADFSSNDTLKGNARCGVVARFDTTSDDAILALLDGDTTQANTNIGLWRRTSAGTINLTTSTTFEWLNDVVHRIRLETEDLTGDDIECKIYIDDVLQITHTITSSALHGVPGKPGIAGRAAVTWTNSEGIFVDNFEAGVITSTDHEYAGTGIGTSGGSAVINVDHEYSGTGTGTSGGSAVITVDHEYEATGLGTSGGSAVIGVADFSFKWSIDNLEARTDYGFPTVYVDIDKDTMPTGAFPTGDFYERRLTQLPRLEEQELDSRFGISGFQRVSFTVDNSDMLITGFDIQDAFVRMFFVDDSGNVYKEFKGQVVDWTLSHEVTINVEDVDALALTQDLPKRTLNDLVEAEKTADAGFAANVVADDLGKPIPIAIGRNIQVPLLYVKADESNRHYDYIIGEGAGLNSKYFQSVTTVYRNEQALDNLSGTATGGSTSDLDLQTPLHDRPDAWFENFWIFITSGAANGDIRRITDHTDNTITPDTNFSGNVNNGDTYELREWRFYDGSQASPYAGYAFLRFRKRMGESGRTDPLYADVNGLEDEVNVVRAIESILSNSDWGFGLSVDSTTFAAAAALSEITAMSCEGGIFNSTSAGSVLRELLGFRDMTLSKADEIEIAVDQAKAASLNLGLGDETGNHNILDASPAIEYLHPDEKVKNLKVRYRKNNKETDTYLHEFERSSSSNGVDTTVNLPFVYDHTTADRWLDYKRKRFSAATQRLDLNIGQDAIAVVRGQAVNVNIPSLGVASDWEVIGANVTPAGSQSLSLVPYSALPYTYVSFTSEGGALPVDESFDIPPDYAGTYPEPISGLSVTMSMDTAGLNAFPFALLTWTAPTDGNYSGAVVSIKLNSDPATSYRASGTYDESARIDGLTPGQLYDFKVESLNVTGEFKSIAVEDLSNLAGGDSDAPNTPTGLTGTAKFGRLIWTFTKSSSSDVAYHEAEVYSASSGGTLLYATTIFNNDEERVEFERQTGDLTDSALTGYCQVRAVDYTGNASSYTSRVLATTEEVSRDDLEDNATMNIENTSISSERPGVSQTINTWYTVLSDSITTDRTGIIKVRYNGQWVDTGSGFELRLKRGSTVEKDFDYGGAVNGSDATLTWEGSVGSGTTTFTVETRNTLSGGTGLGLVENTLSIQGDFK